MLPGGATEGNAFWSARKDNNPAHHRAGRIQRICCRCDSRLQFSCLGKKLARKEAQHIQLQGIGKSEDQFLDPRLLQLGHALTDGFWTADQRASGHWATLESGGKFGLCLLIGLADKAESAISPGFGSMVCK